MVTISNLHTGVYGYFEKVPKTTDNTFRLLRNGELVAELAANPGGEESNYAMGNSRRSRLRGRSGRRVTILAMGSSRRNAKRGMC